MSKQMYLTYKLVRISFLTAVCVLHSTILANAQRRTISLPGGEVTFGRAFREIERQTKYIFAVDNLRFDVSQKVRLERRDYTITEGLEKLLAGTGHTFRITGSHILIVPQAETAGQRKEQELAKPLIAPLPEARIAAIPIIIDDSELHEPIAPIRREKYVAAMAEITDSVSEYYHYESPDILLFNRSTRIRRKNNLPAPDGAKIAVKTNLIYAAALRTPNLGIEIALGKSTTLSVSGGYNPWNLKGKDEDNDKLIHWVVQPEFRYWFCERFNGHYVGAHAFYSQYNVGGYKVGALFDKEYRHEGNAYGVGVSYGYHWMMSRHWGVEFTLGFGMARMKYDRYDCERCSLRYDSKNRIYVGPTKVGVSLVYVF